MSNYWTDYIYDEFERVVGKDNITDSQADLDAYSFDIWWPPRMYANKGEEPISPDCIVFPTTTEEVSEITKLANEYDIPLIPRGGGAGDTGGILPIYGGIVMDLKKLNSIKNVDEKSQFVTAQTGIWQSDLEEELNRNGYTTNHLPASLYCSTLGGFLSTRGSGVLSSKYGKIENMVMSLEVVLPTGEIINTPPVPQHSAGPDMNRFFVGAEGTLGTITEAKLQIDKLPADRRFRAYLFKDLHQALESGREIMTQRLEPCVIRIYDEQDTRIMIRDVLDIEREEVGGYMVMGFDGNYEDGKSVV